MKNEFSYVGFLSVAFLDLSGFLVVVFSVDAEGGEDVLDLLA